MTLNQHISLRELCAEDLELLFAFETEAEALHMAAFTAKDPSDRGAFDEHWARIMSDESVPTRAVLVDRQFAGTVLSYVMDETREVSYWIGRDFWGRGIATAALTLYLELIEERPLRARVASDNFASRRVLEKCGFAISGEARGFANARGEIIDELVLNLGTIEG